jgi:hypothetical protein
MTLPYTKRKTRQMADLSRKMTVDLSNTRVGIASTIPVSALDIGLNVDSTGLTGNLTGIAKTASSLNSSVSHVFTGNMTASKFVGFGSALTGVGYTASAVVMDRKAAASGGGSFNSDSWITRDLNTWINPDGIISVSSNEFTLQAGEYLIEWICPGYASQRNKTRLYNVTDGEVPDVGPNGGGVTDNGYIGNFNTGMTMTAGSAIKMIITSAKSFKIQHRCTNTNSFGIGSGDSDYWSWNYYTMVWIYKGG